MATSGSKKSSLMKYVYGVLVTLGVIVVSVMVVMIFGQVQGTEICAETLERRSFWFLEVPLIRLQIRPTHHVDLTGPLEKHLVSEKILVEPPAAKKTWHIILMTRGMAAVRRGDAEFLTRYLDARDNNREYAWLEWTKSNPQVAKHVWQGVRELALASEYTTVPELLEFAQRANDPVKAQAEVQKILQQVIPPAEAEPAPADVKSK